MKHSVEIFINGCIPESQHTKTVVAQVTLALPIVRNFFR
jgi:hypothetical protein